MSAIIKQDRFKLNSNCVANKFILAHEEDIPRILSERDGIEVRIFLDPDGKIYFIPIENTEYSQIREILDNHIELIDDFKLDTNIELINTYNYRGLL